MKTPTISRWSTDGISQRERFDYYVDALSSALVPMEVQCLDRGGFWADMEIADLGLVSVVRQRGCPHRAYRADPEFGRDEARTFHILLSLSSPWSISHIGEHCMEAGDALVTDSRFNHDIHIDATYEFVHLKLSETWIRQWVPHPDVLVSRRIPGADGWGRALTSYVAQLSPRFLTESPLPLGVITDQVGGVLALLANEIDGGTFRTSGAGLDWRQRIHDSIQERCAEPSLTAASVAEALGISTRTLHRGLARFGETFGGALMTARTNLALRMLESPLFRRLTTAEIGRRAGFVDASHFARVFRLYFGATPAQIRRGKGTATREANEEQAPLEPDR